MMMAPLGIDRFVVRSSFRLETGEIRLAHHRCADFELEGGILEKCTDLRIGQSLCGKEPM